MAHHQRSTLSRPSAKPYSTDLFTLRTDDDVAIDGALYVPQRVEPIDTALLLVHGKTGNFYSGAGRFLPPMLAGEGISSFSMNMRCHDLGYKRTDLAGSALSGAGFSMGGGAWEKIEEGHRDLKAGVEFLRRLGYNNIVLCGHSSGGFYAVDYVGRYHDVVALALLSPLTTNKTAVTLWFETDAQIEAARRQAEALVAQGHGHYLLPLKEWYWAISAASLLDRLDERQGWFDDALASVRVPTLWLVGSAETRVELWTRYWDQMLIAEKQLSVIEGADHGYTGCERAAYEAMRKFLARYVVAL